MFHFKTSPEISFTLFFCNEMCITCMHLEVFQSTTCSSIHIKWGIRIRPDIYFCVTGYFMGSCPADVSNLLLFKKCFSYMSTFFFPNRFWLSR